MRKRSRLRFSGVAAVLLVSAILVPATRAQVVRLSRAALLFPRTLLSLPPAAQVPAAQTAAGHFSARSSGGSGSVIVGASYRNDRSAPLRDIPAVPYGSRSESEREGNANPKIPSHHRDSPDGARENPEVAALALQSPAMPSPILSFDGIPFPGVACNCAPPDTDGEVGATQYVQIVNEGYRVFDKATGTSVLGPVGISTIWSGFGGLCESSGAGDPIVLYDQLANRWIVSQFAVDPSVGAPTDECVAISVTSDATGSYDRYGFHLGTNYFDYPKLSVWPDAYYMSMNVFDTSGTAFLGPQPFAFDRAAMLGGGPATFISTGITGGPAEDVYLPADLDGTIPPPAGAPGVFVEFPGSGAYKTWHFHADFANPASSTFTLFASPAAAAFTELCPFTRACVPQLGGDTVDGIGDRLMYRLAYRNLGDHESVVGNFTVGSGGVAGIRWFELRNVTSGPVTVFQESTYQPDTTWRWMGSVAQDRQGNLALGFSASSPSINPQIRYAGRLATDPINTLAQGEAHLFDGAGSQVSTGNRWGDYSALSVDPGDDCTFWYTQEYYSTTSNFNWKTRIGSFKFPECLPATPTPTVTGTPPTSTPTRTSTPTMTPTPIPTPVCALAEGFDNIQNLPNWVMKNNSSPLGGTGWFQGNPLVFGSQSGASSSYIAANYNNGNGVATISNWLLTPPLTLQNGGQLTFWTRTVSAPQYPDRLQVRMSVNGLSADVGTTATSVGDFTAPLLDINPTYTIGGYPTSYTLFTVNISGLGAPTTGRLAFRYFVENGGPSGANSDYIGIDTVQYNCVGLTPTATPTRTNTATATPTSTPTGTATATPTPLPGINFYTVVPCRVLDTRDASGPLGGPSLSGGNSRTFIIINSCGIPPGAVAVSVNIAETQPQGAGHLRIYPAGSPLPNVSAINFSAGQTRSNNAILSLGAGGGISVYAGIGAGQTVDFVLDVNGYFQ
jgi:hypothetical protein